MSTAMRGSLDTHPALVTGVWVGYDQPRTIAPGGYAAQLAVPLWTRFMMSATQEEEKAERFPTPSSVTSAAICPLSGKLATSACYGDPSISVRTEYFEHGTEPIDYCTYHLLHRAPPMTVASATMTPAPSPAAPAAAAPNTAPESVAQPNAATCANRARRPAGEKARVLGPDLRPSLNLRTSAPPRRLRHPGSPPHRSGLRG